MLLAVCLVLPWLHAATLVLPALPLLPAAAPVKNPIELAAPQPNNDPPLPKADQATAVGSGGLRLRGSKPGPEEFKLPCASDDDDDDAPDDGSFGDE